ncbi:hypothetical protein BACCIP111895_01866 [Neobacillus rhizosphaerae]|uniref:Uncharacterized protein n=1 Tax=Neobacillus rhizosphaerae TaxID=2880965 RepID=A0ABM9EPZ7_9BACI|nr:hypothetical protein BACCIP111895_01866 [Neobacillus rhizosphaerae]
MGHFSTNAFRVLFSAFLKILAVTFTIDIFVVSLKVA